MSDAKQTYQGSCHCQSVRFTVDAPDLSSEAHKSMTCDCSHCSKKGVMWGFADPADFKMIKAMDMLTEYEFGPKNLTHLFCKKCGSVVGGARKPVAFGEGFPTAYNVLLLRSLDPHAIPTMPYAGSNVEPQYTPAEPIEHEFTSKDGTVVYNGSCHCKAIKFKVQTKPLGDKDLKLINCNCSMCGGSGVTWLYPRKDDYALSADADSHFTTYQRENGAMGLTYHFCKTCGSMVYGSSPGMSKMGYGDACLNARLLDGVNVWEDVVGKATKVSGRTGWGGEYVLKE